MHISTLQRYIPDLHITVVTSEPSLIIKGRNISSISRTEFQQNNIDSDLTLIASATNNHILDALAARNTAQHLIIDKPLSHNPSDTSQFISSFRPNDSPTNI